MRWGMSGHGDFSKFGNMLVCDLIPFRLISPRAPMLANTYGLTSVTPDIDWGMAEGHFSLLAWGDVSRDCITSLALQLRLT